MGKRILQIWLDESGDFDSPKQWCPIYILGMAFKNRDVDIVQEEKSFLFRVGKMQGGDFFVHTANLIRNEEPYRGMPRQDRQKLFWALTFYALRIPVSFGVVTCRKKSGNRLALLLRIKRELELWIYAHLEYLRSFDELEVIYDYGQAGIAPVVNDAFGEYQIPIIITRRKQQESTMLQVADLLCEYALLDFKYRQGNLTHGEIAFFGYRGKIKKDFLNPIRKKLL